MKKAELQTAITKLRLEIESLEDEEDETRENLAQLANMMQEQLETNTSQENPSLNNAVIEMVEAYEARHPRITAIVNDIMTKLAGMGI